MTLCSLEPRAPGSRIERGRLAASDAGGLGASIEFMNLVNEAIRLSVKDQQARVVASINLAAAASDGIRVRGSSEDDGIRVTAVSCWERKRREKDFE